MRYQNSETTECLDKALAEEARRSLNLLLDPMDPPSRFSCLINLRFLSYPLSSSYTGFHVILSTHQTHFNLITLFWKHSLVTNMNSSLPNLQVFAQMSFSQWIIYFNYPFKMSVCILQGTAIPLPSFICSFIFIAHNHLLKAFTIFLLWLLFIICISPLAYSTQHLLNVEHQECFAI